MLPLPAALSVDGKVPCRFGRRSLAVLREGAFSSCGKEPSRYMRRLLRVVRGGSLPYYTKEPSRRTARVQWPHDGLRPPRCPHQSAKIDCTRVERKLPLWWNARLDCSATVASTIVQLSFALEWKECFHHSGSGGRTTPAALPAPAPVHRCISPLQDGRWSLQSARLG